MRYYIDTEFYEDGQQIYPISLGVATTGPNPDLYIQFQFDWTMVPANHWIQENVRPYQWPREPALWRKARFATIPVHGGYNYTKKLVAQRLQRFVRPDPEFWGYYADYDWVLIAQLFGRMVDLPEGWPMYCRDLKQEVDRVGNPELPKPSTFGLTEHNSLDDARWAALTHAWLERRGAVD